jgi:hypothetical protein
MARDMGYDWRLSASASLVVLMRLVHAFMISSLLWMSPALASVKQPTTKTSWHQTELIRTFWCEPPADDQHLKTLKDEKYTLTWCAADALDTVAKHGLGAMIHDETILKPWALDDPMKRKQLDALIDRVKLHPALQGYWLADEPMKTGEMQYIGRLADYIQRRDPQHFCYVNALPIHALGLPAYESYLADYFKYLHPQIFSYDHYPFYKNYDFLDYFHNLEIVRSHTLEANIPFVNIIQASTYLPDWRALTPAELRWEVYSSLAYGAKGISYFLYWGPKKFGGLYQDGKPMPLSATAAQLNAEVDSLSKVMMPLKSVAVYHTAPLPGGTHLIPATSPIQIPNREHGHFVIGLFENPNNKQRFVMVMNRDYRKAHTVKLRLHNSSLLAEYDRSKRSYIAVPESNWSGEVAVPLEAGDARLFTYSAAGN